MNGPRTRLGRTSQVPGRMDLLRLRVPSTSPCSPTLATTPVRHDSFQVSWWRATEHALRLAVTRCSNQAAQSATPKTTTAMGRRVHHARDTNRTKLANPANPPRSHLQVQVLQGALRPCHAVLSELQDSQGHQGLGSARRLDAVLSCSGRCSERSMWLVCGVDVARRATCDLRLIPVAPRRSQDPVRAGKRCLDQVEDRVDGDAP